MIKKRFPLILLLYLCFIHFVFGRKSFEELDKRYESFTQMGGPGFVISILKNGKTLHQGAFGYANIKKKIKNNFITNFNLASNSKQFTAGLALVLEQEGKLNLNENVSIYISELKFNGSHIKISDLIHHTSGLPDYMELCHQLKKVKNSDILTYVSKKSLLFKPGSKYEYSNTGYVVLSELLMRVAKKDFRSLISEKIFSPLKMDTSFIRDELTERNIHNRALGYSHWPWFDENDEGPCNYNYGDGAVYTNINDYAKWLLSLHSDTLFNSSSKQKIFSTYINESGGIVNYGYGWILDKINGQEAYLHNGSWQGSKSVVAFFPKNKLWIIILSNYGGIQLSDVLDSYLELFDYTS